MLYPDRGNSGDVLTAIYQALRGFYGPQRWWPSRTGSAWEIMLGAVLTQHTTWTNVELALQNLASAWGLDGLRCPEIYLEQPMETLRDLLRPAGFNSVKPRKVQSLARFVLDAGGLDALMCSTEETGALRQWLLAVWGVGPETADAILLYALDRPIFVADAYALRLCSRWGLLLPSATYRDVQALFMDNLPHDVALFNEYHALIVAHGKRLCRPRPLCDLCPLNTDVPTSGGTAWRCPKLLDIQ